MSVSYESICQSLGGGLIGGAAGGSLFWFSRTVAWPQIRDARALRKRRKELGGLPDLHVTDFDDGLPPDADRRAFGQMLAYMVELGPKLGEEIQREAHQIIRQKARGEEYQLTPETARWMICLAGVSPPDVDAVWELIDEACDLLGQEHLERKE